jgi:hypothetical protein
MKQSQKTAKWFWVLGVLLVIWNAMGCLAYLGQKLMTPEQMAALPEDQLTFIEMTPAWITTAFALAVWGGLLASILMLLRKSFAHSMFIASLIGVIIQTGYNFFIAGAYQVFGPEGLVMPVVVLSIGIYCIYFTRQCKDNGLLR